MQSHSHLIKLLLQISLSFKYFVPFFDLPLRKDAAPKTESLYSGSGLFSSKVKCCLFWKEALSFGANKTFRNPSAKISHKILKVECYGHEKV